MNLDTNSVINTIDTNVWMKIFLYLHPKYNRVLRKVCRKFNQVTNSRLFLIQQTQIYSPLRALELAIDEPLPPSIFDDDYQKLLKSRKALFSSDDPVLAGAIAIGRWNGGAPVGIDAAPPNLMHIGC